MLFYAGTYTSLGGPGITVCELTGRHLRLLGAYGGIADPIWLKLSADGCVLYAAGNDPVTGEGTVASYNVRNDSIELLSTAETSGAEPCHLTLDPEEHYLYAANYGSGSVSVFPVSSGRILKHSCIVTHEGHGTHPGRQETAHTHQAVFRPGTRELFITDLGLDTVMVYGQDAETGMLSLRERILAAAGSGARHLIFADPDLFYLIGELDSTVSVFACDNGSWRCLQSLSALPSGYAFENTAAAVRIAGKRLYVSNRGNNSIALFGIETDRTLTRLSFYPSYGSGPRDFAVLEDGSLLVANQGGNVALLDPSGRLLSSLPLPGAVCVLPRPDPLKR